MIYDVYKLINSMVDYSNFIFDFWYTRKYYIHIVKMKQQNKNFKFNAYYLKHCLTNNPHHTKYTGKEVQIYFLMNNFINES